MKKIKLIITPLLIASLGAYAYFTFFNQDNNKVSVTTLDSDIDVVILNDDLHLNNNNKDKHNLKVGSSASFFTSNNTSQAENHHIQNKPKTIEVEDQVERLERGKSRLAPPPPLMENQSRSSRHDDFKKQELAHAHEHDHRYKSQSKQDYKAPQPAH